MEAGKSVRRLLGAILLVALALRLGNLGAPSTSGPGRYPDKFGNLYYFSDDYDYSMLAVGLLEGKGYIWWDEPEGNYVPEGLRGQPCTIRAPGYPFFLAAVYAVFGVHPLGVQLLQVGMGLLVCLLVRDLALRVSGGSQGVGLLAAAWAAVWPAFIFYTRALLAETLFLFLVTLFLRNRVGPSRGRRGDLLDGLVLGAAMLVRSPVVFLPPFLFLADYLGHRGDRPALLARWRGSLVVSVVALAVITPWTLRNYGISGRIEPVSSGGSITFFLGNYPGRQQGGQVFGLGPGFEDRVGEGTPDHARGPILMRATLEAMRADPARAGRKFVEKALWFLYPFDGPLYYLGRYNVHWGLCACFFLVGLWALRRTWRPTALLWVFVAYYFAIHVLVQSLTRYRLICEPTLLAGAALGAAWLWRPGRRAWALALLALNLALYARSDALHAMVAGVLGR
ncbi:MAG: glycosyltransferase family 39 protein [Planctomycetes bacterium]|nr:glycosyltransferase family 39 protein [Planctomycetota bacterium]